MSRTAHAAADAEPAPAILDQAGFATFYDATSPGLWRYLCRVAGDAAVADDLLQESYLRLLGRPLEIDDPKRLKGYLYRVATNLLRDRWRRRRGEQSFLERWIGRRDRWSAETRSDHAAVAARSDVGAVLTTLAPRQRALLWLAYVEGYRHREIAAMLGLRAGSIRVMLHRARKKLARALSDRGYADPTGADHAAVASGDVDEVRR